MKRKIAIAIAMAIMIILVHFSYSTADSHRLVLLTEQTSVVNFSTSVPIQVQYLDGSDRPIPDAPIIFSPQSDTADTTLRNLRVLTDSNGIAETFIEAGVTQVDFDVLIGVYGYDIVPPITVHVRVIPPDGRVPEVNWPSEEFRSIQDAIHALADGGTLRIAEGVYNVDEPLFIRNKMVNIVGEGANCKDLLPGKEQFYMSESREIKSLGTVLVGPQVKGRVPPGESIGNLNFNNGGGSVEGIWLKGAKAGIVGRDIDGAAKPLDVSDVCITDTVRGIHWKAAAPITVADTIIADVEWNGISIAPETASQILIENLITDTYIADAGNFCIVTSPQVNAYAAITNVNLHECAGGGIAAINTILFLADSTIHDSDIIGVWLHESSAQLYSNWIYHIRSIGGHFGDGVDSTLSQVIMVDNSIEFLARAGIANWGSTMTLEDNRIRCMAFEIEGGLYNGVDFTFYDVGGNQCGCPFYQMDCGYVSVGLEPPAPSIE